VSGLTNGRAAAQIKFQVPSPASGDRRIVWSSVDLIRGRIERASSSRTVEVRFRNYLQLAGVRPGTNTFTVELERFGDVEVERLRIFDDSGVELTRLAPARLALEPALPAARVRAGDEFEVGFKLRNRGGRPARNVVVAVQFPSRALAPVGPAKRRAARVRRELVGAFRFRALRPGRYRLALGVRSSANRPLAVIDVPISDSRARPGRWRPVPIVAGALIAALGLLLLLAGGDRRKRTSR
jgi:hypothetical protein